MATLAATAVASSSESANDTLVERAARVSSSGAPIAAIAVAIVADSSGGSETGDVLL